MYGNFSRFERRLNYEYGSWPMSMNRNAASLPVIAYKQKTAAHSPLWNERRFLLFKLTPISQDQAALHKHHLDKPAYCRLKFHRSA